MKRLMVLILVLTLLVLAGTIVSSAEGQTRRHRSDAAKTTTYQLAFA
jgi:hypothetical protein